MKQSIIFNLIFFVSCLTLNAQNKTVLFTVDDTPVYTSEFKRVYSKNLDLVKDDSQKDINNYLDLFVKYKLKITEAKVIGLDQKPSYLREFGSYKNQLSKNYLSNNEVTDKVVKEAYDRLKTEVDANHILVRIDENVSDKQVLLAKQEIDKLRKRAIVEGFEALKKDIHNGRTLFAEELGYFTAFKMVYDFENAAYNTEVGQWSQPFRTQFGFHIVQVKDKRQNRGEVTVAHIMLNEKDLGHDNHEGYNHQSAQDRINEIHKRITQGEDFEALAKQFSEDKSSSANGGELTTFSAGQLSSKVFEKEAFGLKEVNQVSKPFKSEFGYHIVKLLGKEGVKPFEELEAELKDKVKRDSRSKVINNSRFEKLLTRYDVSDKQPNLKAIEAILTDDFFKSSWTVPSDFNGEVILFTLNKKQIRQKEFVEFLSKSQRRRQAKIPFDKLLADNYKAFLESTLLQYQEENLENENKEYAQILTEYRDGLLLFDLMETQIWNVAKTDSVGLMDYYLANKADYFFNERVDAIVASSASKSIIKKTTKLLGKNKTIEDIKSELNSDNKINVSFIVDTLDLSHQTLPKGFKMNIGVSNIFRHNEAYSVVKVKEVLSKTEKTFEEAKGNVISDFQQKTEEQWLASLAKKYKVSINEEALKQVKKELQ